MTPTKICYYAKIPLDTKMLAKIRLNKIQFNFKCKLILDFKEIQQNTINLTTDMTT